MRIIVLHAGIHDVCWRDYIFVRDIFCDDTRKQRHIRRRVADATGLTHFTARHFVIPPRFNSPNPRGAFSRSFARRRAAVLQGRRDAYAGAMAARRSACQARKACKAE
jgi:hypothetical protein